MTGHSRWQVRKAEVSQGTLLYVQGYILACDDVLSEVDNMGPEGSEDYWEAKVYIIGQVEDMKREAEDTLTSLNKLIGERRKT